MPPKQKNEQERLQARHRILDAARALFLEQGIDAVTMREIAKRLDCSATALYLHFRDKEALMRTLCDTDFLELAHELQAMEQVADPLERLRMLGIGYARFALTHPNHYRLMFMTPQMGCQPGDSSIEHGNPSQDAYACLKQVVADAHAAECFATGLDDVSLIAQTLWAGIHGVCALEITMQGNEWLDWRAFEVRFEAMQETMLRGLLRKWPTQNPDQGA